MEANEKLKQEADSHNKTKKQNAEFAMGAAGREHTLLELQDKVATLQRARDALEAEAAALQVNKQVRSWMRQEVTFKNCVGSTRPRENVKTTRDWTPTRDGN